MKKNHFLPMACLIASVMVMPATHAQSGKTSLMFNSKSTIAAPAANARDLEALKALSSINSRIGRDLMRNYPGINEISYFQSKGITYIHCKKDGIKTTIGYNKKGRWNHCLSYYSANQVPAQVVNEVKEVFPDFTILDAVKVKYGGASVHVVTIEKGNTWKKVRVAEDGVDIMKEYIYQ